MVGQDAISDLQDLSRQTERLRSVLSKQTARQLSSVTIKGDIKDYVQSYFRIIRPHLVRTGVETTSADDLMQRFLELANSRGAISQYKTCIAQLREELKALEIAAERQLSDAASEAIVAPSPVEAQILETLRQLSPSTAASYEQVIDDLSRSRLSFRGTATELREIVRETLDKLAPNSDVETSPGFQLEKGRDRPTMAQKAKFILRQRGIANNSIDVPKKAIEIVEQTVSSFVRSTYDRGSIDTHTISGISKSQVAQLKMYVDTVLCELLEIHGKAETARR